MVRFALRALCAALGFWLASRVVHGVYVSSLSSLLTAGLVLGLANAMVRPVMVILTLPLTIVTFGALLLVVNGMTVMLVDIFMGGVEITGPWPAVVAALVISLTVWICGYFIDPRDERYA
jgi:putative membrane protein